MQMNSRVFFAAILGISLFLSLFYLAPVDLTHTGKFLFLKLVLVEVAFMSAALHFWGWKIIDSRIGIVGWRWIFGVHAAAYALAWGYGCEFILEELKITPYAISVTTTALAACVVAVSCFAFDLIVCWAFLASVMAPLLHTSITKLEDAHGLTGALLLSLVFFSYLSYLIHRSEVARLLQSETIKAQATALEMSNEELIDNNVFIKNVIESVDEVFMVIGIDGVCFGTRSERATAILGADPIGRHLTELFGLTGEAEATARKWLELLMLDKFEFKGIASQGPRQWVSPTTGQIFRVRYYPMRGDDKLSAIIVTMLDITKSIRMAKQTEEAEVRARFILAVSEGRTEFAGFIHQLGLLLQNLSRWNGFDLQPLRLALHTLKGTAGFYNVPAMVHVIDQLENRIKSIDLESESSRELIRQAASEGLTSFRHWLASESPLFDKLHVFDTEEIRVTETQLLDAKDFYAGDPTKSEWFEEAVARLRARDLDAVLGSFEAHVYKLAEKLGKWVRYEVVPGFGHVRLIGDSYEPIFKGMVHLFNNALDHGIETPGERLEAGKGELGQIFVSWDRVAGYDGVSLLIRIEDDGRGMSEDVLARAFDAGYSTASVASEISGQGIGLSALKEQVVVCGGSIEVSSEIGRGTRFLMRLPAPADRVWFVDNVRNAFPDILSDERAAS